MPSVTSTPSSHEVVDFPSSSAVPASASAPLAPLAPSAPLAATATSVAGVTTGGAVAVTAAPTALVVSAAGGLASTASGLSSASAAGAGDWSAVGGAAAFWQMGFFWWHLGPCLWAPVLLQALQQWVACHVTRKPQPEGQRRTPGVLSREVGSSLASAGSSLAVRAAFLRSTSARRVGRSSKASAPDCSGSTTCTWHQTRWPNLRWGPARRQ